MGLFFTVLNRPVKLIPNFRSDIHLADFIIIAGGVNAVGKKNVHGVCGGVNPCERSGVTRMPEALR